MADLLERLTDAVADGSAVDWEAAASGADTQEERELVSQLRVLAQVGALHRQDHPPGGPRPSHLRLVGPVEEATAPAGAPTPAAQISSWRHLQVRQLVGRGTFGVVYRAWDPQLERDVALKLMPADPGLDASVIREGRLLARVRHPNVVSIHGADEADGRVGLWMDFVRGRTLRQLVDTNGPMSAHEALLVGLDLARALAAVHSSGLVHRDVKAQNVMREDGGRVVLMDFGAGDEIDSVLPRRASGTPLYMAPELFEGGRATIKSDIYSLGVLLFYLATGTHPVPGDTSEEVKQSHKARRRRLLRDVRPDLPPAFVKAVDLFLQRDPAKRPVTAGAAEAVLEAALVPDRTKRAGLVMLIAAVTLTAAVLAAWPAGLWNRFFGGGSGVHAVAVLPLANLSGDASQDYVVDGMTDLLIAELSGLSALKVTARTSVMGYKNTTKPLGEIGRELNVDSVLEASMAISGPQVRLTASLLRVSDGSRLWTKAYERPIGDTFTLQATMVRDLVSAVRLALTPEDETRLATSYVARQDAQEQYLRGRSLLHQFDRTQTREACSHFEDSVRLDPQYALAWASLSRCRVLLENYGLLTPEDARPGVVDAAMHAIDEDPSLAEAHTALADARFKFDWDWTGARDAYDRAVVETPSFSFGHGQYARFLAAAGRVKESVEHARRGVELDPQSADARVTLAMMLYYAREFDEALQRCEEAARMNAQVPGAHFVRGRVLSALGRYPDAVAALKQAVALSNDPAQLAELGRTYAAAGQMAEAQQVVDQLTAPGSTPGHDLAYVLAAIGKKDDALAILDRAVMERSSRILWLRVDPRVDPVRDDPRFAGLLSRLGGLD